MGVACVVVVVSLVVAYILVSRLQRSITRPVTDLVEMMGDVSRDKDFSVRAPGTGEDELGSVARGFNEMLSTIQDRDRELEAPSAQSRAYRLQPGTVDARASGGEQKTSDAWTG